MNGTICIIRMLCVIAVLCVSLASRAGAAGADGSSPGAAVSAADPSPQDESVVARMGDYVITKDELVQKLLQEIRPREEEYPRQVEPPTARSVLRKMLAEKATSMEGRRLGYLDDEQIHPHIVQYEERQIVGKLLEGELGDKLTVEDAEIDRVMKSNPKATREQAKMVVQRAKANQLMEQFYQQVTAKRNLKKVSENLAKAAEIHQRLLTQPSQPRGPSEYWIRNSQIATDLSQEEKDLPLATFDGGRFTLKDWFQSLCNIAPPRRPKDLDTAQGVEKLLDMALRAPVLAAEARSKGYDQDPAVRSAVRAIEDQRLLYKVQQEKTSHIAEPTIDQVKEYFEKDPERFAKPALMRIDQIWCQDEETARKAKSELENDEAFESVWQKYSLDRADREKASPSWLSYFTKPDVLEILPNEADQTVVLQSVIPAGTTTRGGFEITVPEGEQMTVTILTGERIVYWAGKGEIKKVSSQERVAFPPFETTVSRGGEGIFWGDLWKGEVNQIVGPMRGFYGRGVRWRILRVLEKTPPEVQPFSEQLGNSIKWALYGQWRQQAVSECEQKLLEKYPYEVFSNRIKDLDPLEIAMKQ